MSKPSVSIITVCYNSVKTIEATLRSVISQDYPIEYIVIDGNSTDGTQAILARYRHSIHTLVSETDGGIYEAMNKGIRLANSEVIGLLNADDIYAHPKIIARIAKTFLDDKVEACYGDLTYFTDEAPDKIYRYWKSNKFIPGAFAKGWSPPHPTFFVRKKIYEQYGNFDLSYSMGNDIELMMRFLEKHQICAVYLPAILVKMRKGGISNRSIKNIIEQNSNILKAARSHNIPLSPSTFIMRKLLNRFSQFIFKPRSDAHAE